MVAKKSKTELIKQSVLLIKTQPKKVKGAKNRSELLC